MLPQLKTKTALMNTSGAKTQIGRGIAKGNPKRCVKCQKLIRAGEAWVKHTSAPDPEFGRYSIIVHARCNGHK